MNTHPEQHGGNITSRLNWLRAAVLGSNDGIISLAALVVGVASATTSTTTLLLTGVSGLLAGAFSMAVGEYVSVSSQRDTERALLEKERYELEHFQNNELQELVGLYQQKGLTLETAQKVAEELTAHDVFAAHVDAELGIDPHTLANPWQAAFASAVSFTVGALIPLITIVLLPEHLRVALTFVAVFIALVITGILSAKVSGARTWPVTMRILLGGISAMIVTFGIGKLFGTIVQ
jgi:VIT1/CCC1 family predicted Fe2+/Mn2+ transporter